MLTGDEGVEHWKLNNGGYTFHVINGAGEWIVCLSLAIGGPHDDVSTIIQSERGNQRDGCGWHVWILLRIPVARILWDFDFLRELAPGRLDGFSIGRYEKNCESFDLYAVKFESGAMRFWGGKIAPALEPFQNKDSSLLLLIYGTVNGLAMYAVSFYKEFQKFSVEVHCVENDEKETVKNTEYSPIKQSENIEY